MIAPFSALAKFAQTKRVDKGFKVDAGKDRFNEPISLFEGDTFFSNPDPSCNILLAASSSVAFNFTSVSLGQQIPFHLNPSTAFIVIYRQCRFAATIAMIGFFLCLQ